MNHITAHKRWLILLLLTLMALLAVSPALAQSGGGYDLTWSSVDGGGYMFSTGNGYNLGGTVGQPDTSVMNGGGYTLVGGFWGGAASQFKIFLPIVLRT